MRRIVSLLTAGLLMTAILLTLPAAPASAQCFGCGGNLGFFPQSAVSDFDLDDPNGCFGCGNVGFFPNNQGFFLGDGDFDDFGGLGDCDFVPAVGPMCF